MTGKTYMLWKYVRAFKGQRMIGKQFDTIEEVEKYIRANWYNMYSFSVDSFNAGKIETIMCRNWPTSSAYASIWLNHDGQVA